MIRLHHKVEARQHHLIGPIAEVHIFHDDAALRDIELLLALHLCFRRRRVEHFIHQPRAGEPVLYVKAQTREPFGGIISHQHGGHEREERARIRLRNGDAIAAVENHGADSQPRKRVGDRA